ncbi:MULTISPECIES: DNA-directed DNA polymerase [unclassified Shinella]|uniref:Y-family DNA polymerase n=1 Tax=unclassified Shinella TaxID=2643062 RepID=UPI0003C553B0|nr:MULTISPECIES: DNA-directed DNA polymerase [unclassified Shinella]EYR82447.1 nucleotidyltransferase/DNA polymerase involved in DNA repair [Shinella sp. DD12]MCW5712029.1 type VI secretion protein ImpB [Shinella sp.]TAA50529.1 type VI secretion protein ImpB [Shinella sp. JR1-6]
MRKPDEIERLYLDFDGFFASVEQQADRRLRGRPVGVVPFSGTDRTAVIACSKEAKAQGVKNVMPIAEARRVCPDLILVPQNPDLYRRAHNALLCEIETVIAIDTAKSIDELTCVLDDSGRRDPELLAARIKAAIADNIGRCITSSIGFAANRQLAKIACKAGKDESKRRGSYGDALAIWRPADMPEPLLRVELEEIPGVGSSMAKRLYRNGVYSTPQLYALQPKHMRRIWNNVNGERLWYALHGYDIQAPEQKRGMFGHGRVLPPDSRTIAGAYEISRLLLTKAARRLRRESYYAGGVWLWLSIRDGTWFGKHRLAVVHDDQAILAGLHALWQRVRKDYPRGVTIFRIGVTLYDLSPSNERQIDLLDNDDALRRKWEKANSAVDALNTRYSATIVSMGEWKPPAGGHAGGKISYTRIPSAEDFW